MSPGALLTKTTLYKRLNWIVFTPIYVRLLASWSQGNANNFLSPFLGYAGLLSP